MNNWSDVPPARFTLTDTVGGSSRRRCLDDGLGNRKWTSLTREWDWRKKTPSSWGECQIPPCRKQKPQLQLRRKRMNCCVQAGIEAPGRYVAPLFISVFVAAVKVKLRYLCAGCVSPPKAIHPSTHPSSSRYQMLWTLVDFSTILLTNRC